jgi:hypothetical protein
LIHSLGFERQTNAMWKEIDLFSMLGLDAAHTYVSGLLIADTGGNPFYNVLMLSDPAVPDPWSGSDVLDGNVYAIAQGLRGVHHTEAKSVSETSDGNRLHSALDRADGKLYVQIDGHLFVVGN